MKAKKLSTNRYEKWRHNSKLAERTGFEPAVELLPHSLSKRAP